MTLLEKSIFEYDNYRTFLKDYYQSKKRQDKKFSFRYFSRLLGYTSPVFVKRVIDGTRNVTDDGVQRFIKALKLNKHESEFFKHLVQFNQSKTDDERKIHAQNLLRTHTLKRLLPLKEAQFRYYAEWYFVPLRELVTLPGFREDPQWIAQTLLPPITSNEAKRALEELMLLGLIARDQDGILHATATDVTTPDEIISTFKADWLIELIRLGGESIKRVPREERDISSVTIAVTPNALTEIKELTQKYRRDVMQIASREKEDCGRVYQLSIQLFPLTQKVSGENK